MGLISDYVDTKVNAFAYNYYKDLGYDIPKRKNKNGQDVLDTSKYIKIKVSDLKPNSHVNVLVECDSCGKKLDVIYENYNRIMKKHSQYLCVNCANNKYNTGSNHHNWKSELSDQNRIDRRINPEYCSFVERVMRRDKYTCQCCGASNKKNIVHHLDGYNWCFDKRYDDENGITLCNDCHNNFHVIYGYGNNTREQFLEWLGVTHLELQRNNDCLPSARKVYCYEDGKIYESVTQAQLMNNYKSKSNIYSVCNHKKKHYTAYGKHWFWYDEYIGLSDEEIYKYLQEEDL